MTRSAISGGGGRLLLALPLISWVAACSGGPGAIASNGDFGYDPAQPTGETPPSSVDAPPSTTDAPSSGGGAGGSGALPAPESGGGGGGTSGFSCSGSYTCSTTVNGQTASIPVTLSEQNGQCVGASDKGSLVLSDDGHLVDNGQDVGTWSRTGNGFTITSDGVTLTCTK